MLSSNPVGTGDDERETDANAIALGGAMMQRGFAGSGGEGDGESERGCSGQSDEL